MLKLAASALWLVCIGCTVMASDVRAGYLTIPEVRANSSQYDSSKIQLLAYLGVADTGIGDFRLFEQEEFSQFPISYQYDVAVAVIGLSEEANIERCLNSWVVIAGTYLNESRKNAARGYRDQFVPELIISIREDGGVICPLE